MVRFDRDLVQALVARAPSSFTLTPRNPERRIAVGGNVVCFSTVGGPPNVHDCERGRRSGNLKDYTDFIRLAQSLNIVHYIGNQPCPPVELPAESRHLDCYLAAITYCDRVYQCTAIGPERAIDGIDMMAIARGLTREEMIESPGILTNINCNSPRRYDGPMSDGLMAMADYGQGVVVTPFTLMGAMTPVTMAAALAQQNAEALAGIALTQAVPAGHAGGLWGLYFQCRHAFGRAGLRHAGECARDDRRRPIGAPLRAALPFEQCQCQQCGGRPGSLRIRDVHLERGDGRRQPAVPWSRLA